MHSRYLEITSAGRTKFGKIECATVDVGMDRDDSVAVRFVQLITR